MKIQFSNINTLKFRSKLLTQNPAYPQEKGILKPASQNGSNVEQYCSGLSNKYTGNILFGKGVLPSKTIKNKKAQSVQNSEQKKENNLNFRQALSLGLKEYFDEDIPESALKSIITPDEFQEVLKEFNQENFTASQENLKSGIYKADLDYQSCFSNGKKNITDILDNVSQFANKYYLETGNDFYFALTDRDTTEGLKHAIRIIGNYPYRFKHVKFIPGMKMTFAHEAPASSKIGFENSEMLVYGINPFSENLEEFITNTLKKRRTTVIEFMKKVNEIYPEFAYSIIEFAEQNRLKYEKDFTISNLYWRAREYAETKGDTAITGIELTPEDILTESANIIQELHEVKKGSDENGFSPIDTTLTEDTELNQTIKGIFKEYSTHYDEEKKKVVSSAENLYNEMIECFSSEPYKPVLCVCAPYYLSHYFNEKKSKRFPKTLSFINNLRRHSNGMLKAFESVVPSYNLDPSIREETIKTFNDYIRSKTKLLETGGSFNNIKSMSV